MQLATPSEHATQRLGGKVGGVRREAIGPQIVAFMDMRELSSYPTTAVPIDETLFSVSPKEIAFQNFIPLQEYTMSVVFRNTDTVPRRLQVLQSTSP